MDRETVYFSETIGFRPAILSVTGTGFYKLLSVFAKLYVPRMPNFLCNHSAIAETTIKQRSFAFIWFDFQQGIAMG